LDILSKAQSDNTWPAAQVTANLGLLYFDEGHYAAAEQEARKALELRRKLGGDDTPNFANSLIEVAEDRAFQGDLARAEPLLRQALEIREKRYTSGHPAILTAQVRLGEVLVAEGKAKEAQPLLKSANEEATQMPFRLPVWQTAEAQNGYGECLKALGRDAEAERFLKESRGQMVTEPRPVFRGDTAERLEAVAERNQRAAK
jgi:tetratricopeptide (TPR) repeat protein